MDKYKLEILGFADITWNTSGQTHLATGHTIIYSGNGNKDDPHDKGVGFVLIKVAKKALLVWNHISERIILTRFDTRFKRITVIQTYAPTNEIDEEEKENFYSSLQTTVDKVPKRDFLIIMGNLNAKVRSKRDGREKEIGFHSVFF